MAHFYSDNLITHTGAMKEGRKEGRKEGKVVLINTEWL